MKPKGNYLFLFLALILFWPLAIVYFLMRDWSGKREKLEK